MRVGKHGFSLSSDSFHGAWRCIEKMAMKVTFWTSVEYMSFMNGLLREMRHLGIDGIQKFQISHASYRKARSPLVLRTRMYLSYPIKIIRHFLLQPDEDIAVVTTNTFYAPFLATIFRRKNQKVVHLVYDLFPDALEISEEMRRNALLIKLLGLFARSTFRRADANIFLGRRIMESAERRYGKIPHAQVIAVGADSALFPDFPELDSSPVRILYCGNMGHMHDTSTIEELLLRGDGALAGTRWIFHASGAGYGRLAGSICNCTESGLVMLGEALDDDTWVDIMRTAHVALVTMKAGAEKVVMPSKTYSAMAAGQAILAICPRASDLADLLVQHDCGWVVEPGDAVGLQSTVSLIAENPDLVLEKRRNAWKAARNNFSAPVLASEWKGVFDFLQKQKAER